MSFFDEKKIGEFLSRLSSDITIIKNGLGVNIALLIRAIFLLLIMLVILFVLSWKLTLVMIGAILPSLVAIQIYSNIERKLVKAAQEKKADASFIAQECFGNSRTVKAFATEEKELKKYGRENDLIFMIGKKRATNYGFFSFFFNFFLYGAILGVIWYGAYLTIKGSLSVGKITSYLFYCVQMIIWFSILSSLITVLMQVSGASGKIIEFIDHIPLLRSRGGSKPNTSNEGDIEFRDVRFSYPMKKDVEVLKGVSF